MTAPNKPAGPNPAHRKNLITLGVLTLFVTATFMFSFTHIGNEAAMSVTEIGAVE